MPPNILGGGAWPTQYLPNYSSICHPVDSKCYWSIEKLAPQYFYVPTQRQRTWGDRGGGLSPPPLFGKGGLSPPKLEVVMKECNSLCWMYSE